MLRFLNAQCIKQGFESEEDYFASDLTLAQWARDARQWATNMLEAEPEVCEELFDEAGEKALDRTRMFYHQHLGSDPAHVDSLDATAALMKWAKRRRGFEYSQYRAQLWEFVVEIVDAALWLGWLFPSPVGIINKTTCHMMNKRFDNIDYDFRPESYWDISDPLEAILKNVKGTNRRQMIRDYWEAGRLPSLKLISWTISRKKIVLASGRFTPPSWAANTCRITRKVRWKSPASSWSQRRQTSSAFV